MKKTILLSLSLITFLSANTLEIGNKSKKVLNIYNNNLAFMQEKETINLTPKINKIIYKNIPNSIITDSVNIKSKNIYPKTQKYFYNTPNLYNVLKANLNKNVYYYLDRREYSKNINNVLKGKLLSINSNYSLIKNSNTKIIGTIPNTNILIQNLPANMYINPFLEWDLYPIKKNTKEMFGVNYLLKNMSWNSEYNVDLISKTKMKINGWFNIKNNSGIDLNNINVNIIAGKVNNIDKKRRRNYIEKSMSMNSLASDAMKSIKSVDTVGLKKYSIPFKVSLMNKQNTQINFINELLDYKLVNKFNWSYYNGVENVKPYQYISFDYKLNKALPSGNIRFYKDTFLGSNKIKDLTKGMKVNLKLNKNYNIFMNNKITNKIKEKNYYLNNKFCKYYYKINLETKVVNNSNKKENIEISLNLPDYTNYTIQDSNIKIIQTKNKNNKLLLNFIINNKSKIKFKSLVEFCR